MSQAVRKVKVKNNLEGIRKHMYLKKAGELSLRWTTNVKDNNDLIT